MSLFLIWLYGAIVWFVGHLIWLGFEGADIDETVIWGLVALVESALWPLALPFRLGGWARSLVR
jgi:hypothetical protein